MLDLVTGATGHIGVNLVAELLRRGRRVRALIRSHPERLDGADVERVAGDVTDPATLRPALAGVDRVFHLAALISIDGDRDGQVARVNVEGAAHVARACREAGVRMLHVSSVHALELHPYDQPADETRPRVSDSAAPAYDRSKAAGEAAVRAEVARGLDAVVVHPTAVLGPTDPEPSRTGRFLLAVARRRMPAVVAGGFDWVDVRDVVAGMLAAMERGRRGESYLLGGRWASLAELAGLMAAAAGVRPPWFETPWALANTMAPLLTWGAHRMGVDPLATVEAMNALRLRRAVDCTKARGELGFAARPLEESIIGVHADFAARGLL